MAAFLKSVCLLLALVAGWLGSLAGGQAQVVMVTAEVEAPVVVLGGSTVLRIYAQILPQYQATTDRIFSWYIDLNNENGLTATRLILICR